jgi:CheY-like chemotaxis protein
MSSLDLKISSISSMMMSTPDSLDGLSFYAAASPVSPPGIETNSRVTVEGKVKNLVELSANYSSVQRLFREIFEAVKEVEKIDLSSVSEVIRKNLIQVVDLCALYQKKSLRDDLLDVGGGEVLFKLHNLNNDAKSLLSENGVLDQIENIFRTKNFLLDKSCFEEMGLLCRAIRIKCDLSHENLELSDLIKHEVEKIRLSARQKFLVNISDTLRIKIDAQKREIFLESLRVLLDNAAKYGKKSGLIEVNADYAEGCLKLSVKNQGSISDPDLIFKEKVSTESLSSKDYAGNHSEGWGFGLLRAKELLQKNGSDLTFSVDSSGDSSMAMGGSLQLITFEIILNLPELVREEELLSAMGGSAGSASSVSFLEGDFSSSSFPGSPYPLVSAKKIKALIIDDEPAVLRVYQRGARGLDKSKIEIFYASDLENALKVFQENSDLAWICSDEQMPGISGMNLIKAIKEEGFKGRSYLCSGDVFDPLPLGIDHAFQKPATVHSFINFFDKTASPTSESTSASGRSFTF